MKLALILALALAFVPVSALASVPAPMGCTVYMDGSGVCPPGTFTPPIMPMPGGPVLPVGCAFYPSDPYPPDTYARCTPPTIMAGMEREVLFGTVVYDCYYGKGADLCFKAGVIPGT